MEGEGVSIRGTPLRGLSIYRYTPCVKTLRVQTIRVLHDDAHRRIRCDAVW
jgi:hypothetical protein